MAYTQLSPTATPGHGYSFTAKSAAGSTTKGTGPFTSQSVAALPGEIHSFTAKSPSSGTVKGTGPFTALSILGIPGEIHSFTAKIAAEAIDEGGSGSKGKLELARLKNKRLYQDDQDILEFAVTYVLSRQGDSSWDH